MEINNTTYRTKQFLNERDISSISYEVKRTRASWDPTLSIPGTERRGGWRCPPGTRYGGQITDRFGRNCGWGVSRRIANEISDLGERLENVGDRRRSRRNAERASRNAERAARPGIIERAAGGIARALETGNGENRVPTPRNNRGAVARRSPRLRRSEERRMNREIVNPGALRTGEQRGQATPNRPRPAAPAARRRPAAQQVVREKPQPVDATPSAAKKAPVKKVAAKKKAVKKKAPTKKAATRRVTPAAGGNAQPPRLSTARPATPKPRVSSSAAQTPQQRASSVRAFTVRDEPLNTSDIKKLTNVTAEDIQRYEDNTNILKNAIDRDMAAWGTGNLTELQETVANQDGYVSAAREELQQAINNLRSQASGTNDEDFRDLQLQVLSRNQNYATALHRRNTLTNRLQELGEESGANNPPLDGLRSVFVGRQIGYERDYLAETEALRDGTPEFESMSEAAIERKIRDYETSMNYLRDYITNLNNLDSGQMISMPNNRTIRAGELKQQVENYNAEFVRLKEAATTRLNAINQNRIPGIGRGNRTGNSNGYEALADARQEMLSLANSNPDTRFSVVEHRNRYFVLSEDEMARAMSRGFQNPQIAATAGGLPLANELPDVDEDVAREAKKRVFDAAKSRQKILADYLDKRYGEGNAPWKDMNRTRMEDLVRAADRGDRGAKEELNNWAKAMYSHEEIQGRNGRTYRTVASSSYSRGGMIGVTVAIERKDEDGRWVYAGRSSRQINISSNPPSVYNSTMFIDNAADKNSGIQTIYNQHAFMYAKAAGFKKFGVTAVDDGRYVWGRIGFKQPIYRSSIAKALNEVSEFRAGRDSVIKNEEDARIFEHLAYSWIRDNNSVRHIDFMMALRNQETSATAKKRRDSAIRSWFLNNMQFSGGELDLEENYITADPRED